MSAIPNDLSLGFVESLYADFLRDPASVPADWRSYFESLSPNGNGSAKIAPAPRRVSIFNAARPGETNGKLPKADISLAAMQERVDQLVRAYRVRGHMAAELDPLGQPRPEQQELDPQYYRFTKEDLDRPFSSEGIPGADERTLRKIINRMRTTYCRSIGVQFMHIDDVNVRAWLQDRMEATQNRLKLSRDEQVRILTRLTDAVILEEFIQKKFAGAKSFSLEGAESLIPLLDMAIERAGAQGIEEIVFGMAHRGRLNVLANIMGKSPRRIFREFDDKDADSPFSPGDVKYHLGHSADWLTASNKKIHLSLCFNPSHLEFVNPVALGRMRAKQDRVSDTPRQRGLVILIHGDAAFAGEGVVQETLNLSELGGYTVGGTIHVVVNNQVGFTTNPSEARSSTYATDVAKMLQTPIFHVNGEDPEAVAQVIYLTLEFRKTFKRDVVIDMYCYRRRGHNEGDEPAFTQPVMYRSIEKRKSVREGYVEHLLKMNGLSRAEADEIALRRREQLESELAAARSDRYEFGGEKFTGIWKVHAGGGEKSALDVETGVHRETLSKLLDLQTRPPENFHPHPKVEKILEHRREMAAGAKPLDWSAGEALAFATLATQGYRVRLSGQDSGRGTFSQRHAVLYDFQDGRPYTPLQHLSERQGPVEIINSPLSEAGVLGFEYGYSLDCPDGLVMWEAQFGDFWNAAQVIVDQFLASAEEKWRRLSGIVLLLPHAFEGMGPEHSSARVERFLMLAANDNIQVVNATTPAQYFHVLRRQILRAWRKPLVVMTPKSLLRHPQAVSKLDDLSAGKFERVIADPRVMDAKRILLCSGKIYYELAYKREELKRFDVAIVRVEQLYPLPADALKQALAPYKDNTPLFWVQEEPENMGAWRFLRVNFSERLLDRFSLQPILRPASASPATGSAGRHKAEQAKLLERAFAE